MWKLLSQQPSGEPTPDLRAQLQPFQGCSPQQIQEQLQSLHIQPDPNQAMLSPGLSRQYSDVESSLSSSSAQSVSQTSDSSSSVASSSRKSSTGSSLIALLSPTPVVPMGTSQSQTTPSYAAYSPPSIDRISSLQPHRRYSTQDTVGVHVPARQKRYCPYMCSVHCASNARVHVLFLPVQ